MKITYLSQCSCPSHFASQYIDRTYSISVERLFEYIFGYNDRLTEYRASHRIKEYQAGPWQVNKDTGKRERLCTYKVDVNSVFGTSTISTNETQVRRDEMREQQGIAIASPVVSLQVIESELSQSHFVIDAQVRNEGIKYADSFYVSSRYCLVQVGVDRTHLRVTCEVKYVKSVMGIIKSKFSVIRSPNLPDWTLSRPTVITPSSAKRCRRSKIIPPFFVAGERERNERTNERGRSGR